MKIRRMVKAARRVAGPVVDVVLPPGCWGGGSGEVVHGLSAGAREQIGVLAAQRYCFHCGLSVGPYETHDAKNPCARCGVREVGVTRMARVGTFSDPLVRLVHQLKFGRAWEVARVLAPFLYQAMVRVSEETGVKVEVIVPVPLHWSRRVRRGFNQAEELAREVGLLSGWRVDNVLFRTRRTPEQAKIESQAQRLENLRGAFECRRGAGRRVGGVAGKHVWLLDDVSTTGATLHAAASALRRLPRGEKAASIGAAVVCVTDHRTLT